MTKLYIGGVRKGMKRIIAFILILVISFAVMASLALPVQAADRVLDLQNQLNQVTRNMQKTQSALKNLKQEKNSVLYEKEKIERDIDIAETELNEICVLLAESEKKIAEKEKEYAEATEAVDKHYELLKHRIRVMYEEGTITYLEVMLASESFADFLSRYEIIREIINHDTGLLKKMLHYKNVIHEAKQLLEDEKAIREKIKNNVEIKRRELDGKKIARNQLLQRLSLQEKEYERALDELEKTSQRTEQEIKRLQEANKRKYAGGELSWPTPSYYHITSEYGNRFHPIQKRWRMHTGIDIGAPRGASVVAANDGVVILAGDNGGYGRCIIIDHGGSIATLYAHNDKLLVNVNQEVKKGQVIAKVGSTGVSTGPHLHFEVREKGATVDPMKYYH